MLGGPTDNSVPLGPAPGPTLPSPVTAQPAPGSGAEFGLSSG
jgi:hypothetical protein